MRKLLLIRHSQPQITPDLPARQWRLSDAGRLRCQPLAARLSAYDPVAFIASAEPKAQETAQIVAAALGRPCAVAEGLHEHDRSNVPWRANTAEWEAMVAAFFERPGELVLGRETAAQARERFDRAIDGVLARHPAGNLAVVAHGTVISLFVAHHVGVAPLPLWRRLGMPAYLVLSLPDLSLIETVESVV
jgi:broad specificity phosphatase PhoE